MTSLKRLNTNKLYVADLTGTIAGIDHLPRRYTLTHSDLTGDLFLTIGDDYDKKRISKMYTRLMRDEILAELVKNEDRPEFRVYCHVSGGFVVGTARWRYKIFQSEMQLVLEAIRYGDRTLFEEHPDLDNAQVLVHFKSTDNRYNKVENWGTMLQYK